MTASTSTPRLAPEHVVYLYRLLRDALGTGKQTFLPRVEDALAADGLAAEELGFADTRALLEAMGDVVQLTVFKGGRVYATVVAQEAWDAALSKADAGGSDAKGGKGKNGKSWKRKRAGKGVKAVRPRAVAKPSAPAKDEAADEAPALPDEDAAPAATDTATPAEADGTIACDGASASADTGGAVSASADDTDDAVAGGPAVADEPAAIQNAASADAPQDASVPTDDAPDAAAEAAAASTSAADNEHASADGNASVPANQEPRPAISLTVIYDPEHANAGITTLESTPGGASDAATAPNAPMAEPETVAASEAAASADSAADGKGADATAAPMPAAAASTAPQEASAPSPAAPEQGGAPAQAAPPAPAPALATQAEQAAQPAPAAPAVQPAPAPAGSPAVPADALSAYPHDFIAEVYCPGPILNELAHLLPLGADIMGIVDEYYHIACERGTIELARNRASFPVRYRARDGRRAVTVHIKKRPRTTPGARTAAWAIASIDHDDEPAASGASDEPDASSNDASPQG